MKLAKHKQKCKTSVYKLRDTVLPKIGHVLRDRERATALESDDDKDELETHEDDTLSQSDYSSD